MGDIYQYNQDVAEKVSARFKEIQENFSKSTKDSAELVEMETYHETVKHTRQHEIFKEYKDLIEWLKLLFQYP